MLIGWKKIKENDIIVTYKTDFGLITFVETYVKLNENKKLLNL